MIKDKPFVSVVIPSVNEEKYLSNCLNSFTQQTFKDFEIIVSDGGSTDKTLAIAQKYQAKTVVTHNSTVTIARQKGVEAASGEIIVGADADTFYPPDHLERIVADFKKDKAIVAVGGGGVFEKKPWWMFWGWKTVYFVYGKVFQYFGKVIYVPAFNLSFKRDVFLKMGGYNTYLDFGGDELDVLDRIKKQGKVYFDKKLHPHPSSRRGSVGFWSLNIKHTLIDYYLNYFLAKLFKRPILRGKPVR